MKTNEQLGTCPHCGNEEVSICGGKTMNPHDATEQAYRNGYEAGYKAAKDEIVRCKDCRFTREKTDEEKKLYFEFTVMCDNTDVVWNESPMWYDDFCSYGERKEKK